MIYGYARCSTDEHKQDIGKQIADLEALGAVQVFSEYESGGTDQRPKLNALFDSVQAGDTVSTTELSRLTRSLHHLLHIMDFAAEKKIKLQLGNLEIDYIIEPDPMYVAMAHIMGSFAELERNLTKRRIKTGLTHAKGSGKKLGRPSISASTIPKQVKKLLPKYQRGELTKKAYAEKCKISRPTLDKYLKILLNQQKE